MWQNSRWTTFVDRNVDWKYLDWQAELLACETSNQDFRSFAKAFRDDRLDYASLYGQLVSLELSSSALQLSSMILSPLSSRLRYGLSPSISTYRSSMTAVDQSIDNDVSRLIVDQLTIIPAMSNDAKDAMSGTFGGLIAFSEMLEARFGLTPTGKLMAAKEETRKDGELREKMRKVREEAKEQKKKMTDEEARETKKEKKAQHIKMQQDREKEFIELPGVSLTLQVLLYTMLMKTKMWQKLLKNPSSNKRNRVEFLTDWFMGFKQKYSKYVLCDTCPYSYDLKDMRNLRNRIYFALEDNGWLFELAEAKKYDELKAALNTGIDVNARNGLRKFKGLLHMAARLKDEALLDLLVPYNPNVNLVDRKVMTPLYYSIENKDISMIRRLLSMGADLSVRDEHNATPFYYAVYCCGLEVLKLLISYGADPSVVCMLQRNCLLKAAFMDKADIVEYLLTFDSVKAMINDADSRGRNPLHASCWGARGGREGKKLLGVEVPDSAKSLEILLDAGADVIDD